MFLKIHEFSRRPVTEQARLRAQLQAVVAVTAAEIQPASRVVLDAADGAAVVVLDDPLGALRLAERALTAVAAGLPLSAGLNHGALQLAGRKGGEGMTGDGIAVAASVAAFARRLRACWRRARSATRWREAAPGGEAALAPAGTSTIPGCARTSCSGRTRSAPGRRSRRIPPSRWSWPSHWSAAASRCASRRRNQQPFVDAMIEGSSPYWKELVQRVGY